MALTISVLSLAFRRPRTSPRFGAGRRQPLLLFSPAFRVLPCAHTERSANFGHVPIPAGSLGFPLAYTVCMWGREKIFKKYEKILWIFEDDQEEEMHFDDLEDCQLSQLLNPSRNSRTLWGQLAELPSLGPARAEQNSCSACFTHSLQHLFYRELCVLGI